MQANHNLRVLARTATGVVLEGTLKECQALAADLCMEVAEYKGRILQSVYGKAVYALATADDFFSCTYVGGGLLMKGRDNWTFVVPVARYRD